MVLPDISSTASKSDIVPTIASTKEFAPSRATIPRVTLPQLVSTSERAREWITQETATTPITSKSPSVQSQQVVRRVNALSSPRKEEFSTQAKRPNLFGGRKASDIVHEALYVPRPQRPRELPQSQPAVIDGVMDYSYVYFCRSKNPSLVQVSPKQRFCHEDRYNKSLQWKEMTITLYEKMSLPQPIPGKAHICTIKNETLGYYTNQWGDPERDPPIPTVTLSGVSNDTCINLINTKRCHRGKLTHHWKSCTHQTMY